MAKEKITCTKCGRVKDEREFFKLRSGERYPVCRDCLTMYIDNRKPSTFKWILEKFDVPYVERKWVELTNREYLKNPSQFNGKSVIGLYVRSMHMNQWAQYGYADSDMLNDAEGIEARRRKEFVQQNSEDDELTRKFEAGEISEAEYRTLKTDHSRFDDPEPHQELEDLSEVLYTPSTDDDPDLCKDDPIIASIDSPLMYIDDEKRKEVVEGAMAKAQEPPSKSPSKLPSKSQPQSEEKEEKEPEEEEILETAIDAPQDTAPGFVQDVTTVNEEDIQSQLTEDDIKYLALKWGLLYKPSEWVKMEELYRKYEASYEISIDREQALKAICKTDLKMNQAIDLGDTKTFKDLQTANDQLRKSAKFTDSQKQEVRQRDLDTIGQLVRFVETEGGIIPQYFDPIECPEDKVDFIINDMKKYTDNLVKNELGLGNLIESYIKKLEENKTQTAEEILKAGISSDDDDYVTQEEGESYVRFVIEERDEEAKRLAEQYVAEQSD